MKRAAALLLISGLTLAGLMAGARPSAAQDPGNVTVDEAAPGATAPAGDEAAPPAAIKAAPAKKKSTEVLPWANKPLTEATPSGDVAATEAAAAQCGGLFEAACRDLKTCAWVGIVVMQDGTEVPSRCVARPPAPPKKAAVKKKEPAKAAAKAPDATGVATGEDAPKPVKKDTATTLDAPPAEVPPAVEAKRSDPLPPEGTAPAEAKAGPSAAKAEKTEASKSPIVVNPPPAAEAPQTPSFGSVSPIMSGDNAVVVTVPPSN